MKHSKNFNSSPAYTSESEGYSDSSGSFDDLQNYLEQSVIEPGNEGYEQDSELEKQELRGFVEKSNEILAPVAESGLEGEELSRAYDSLTNEAYEVTRENNSSEDEFGVFATVVLSKEGEQPDTAKMVSGLPEGTIEKAIITIAEDDEPSAIRAAEKIQAEQVSQNKKQEKELVSFNKYDYLPNDVKAVLKGHEGRNKIEVVPGEHKELPTKERALESVIAKEEEMLYQLDQLRQVNMESSPEGRKLQLQIRGAERLKSELGTMRDGKIDEETVRKKLEARRRTLSERRDIIHIDEDGNYGPKGDNYVGHDTYPFQFAEAQVLLTEIREELGETVPDKEPIQQESMYDKEGRRRTEYDYLPGDTQYAIDAWKQRNGIDLMPEEGKKLPTSEQLQEAATARIDDLKYQLDQLKQVKLYDSPEGRKLQLQLRGADRLRSELKTMRGGQVDEKTLRKKLEARRRTFSDRNIEAIDEHGNYGEDKDNYLGYDNYAEQFAEAQILLAELRETMDPEESIGPEEALKGAEGMASELPGGESLPLGAIDIVGSQQGQPEAELTLESMEGFGPSVKEIMSTLRQLDEEVGNLSNDERESYVVNKVGSILEIMNSMPSEEYSQGAVEVVRHIANYSIVDETMPLHGMAIVLAEKMSQKNPTEWGEASGSELDEILGGYTEKQYVGFAMQRANYFKASENIRAYNNGEISQEVAEKRERDIHDQSVYWMERALDAKNDSEARDIVRRFSKGDILTYGRGDPDKYFRAVENFMQSAEHIKPEGMKQLYERVGIDGFGTYRHETLQGTLDIINNPEKYENGIDIIISGALGDHNGAKVGALGSEVIRGALVTEVRNRREVEDLSRLIASLNVPVNKMTLLAHGDSGGVNISDGFRMDRVRGAGSYVGLDRLAQYIQPDAETGERNMVLVSCHQGESYIDSADGSKRRSFDSMAKLLAVEMGVTVMAGRGTVNFVGSSSYPDGGQARSGKFTMYESRRVTMSERIREAYRESEGSLIGFAKAIIKKRKIKQITAAGSIKFRPDGTKEKDKTGIVQIGGNRYDR